MGALYIVGTPIGNLEDISPRALETLRRVRRIAAENPARTRRLLARYGISTPMQRYTDAYERKKRRRLAAVLEALAEGDVALVSEAGMPGLADPGYELIAAALERGVPVQAIPGPSALDAALSVCGLAAERFIFLGFLPRTSAARRTLLSPLVERPLALVAYESPHRLPDTLADLSDLFGPRPMAVVGELTKLHEQVRRGSAADLLVHYLRHKPRGEFTLVIAAATPRPITTVCPSW